MHPDRKIGIAMGILLVGVVAALFFRNEPLPVDDALSARRENELNERLRERDVAVYLDSKDVENEDTTEPQWSLVDILDSARPDEQALPITTADNEDEPTTQATPTFAPPIQNDVTPNKTESANHVSGNAKPEKNPSPSMTEIFAKDSTADQSADIAQQGEFDEYKIQYGDTLSGISERFLGSHQRYSEIYNANKDRIDNPDRLRVGTAIRIPRVIH